MKKQDCVWWIRCGFGSTVVDLAGPPEDIEQFVDLIRRMTHAHLDWYYIGGIAVLKHFGFRKSRLAVELAIVYLPTPPHVLVRRTYVRYVTSDKVAMAYDSAQTLRSHFRIWPTIE